MAAEVPNIDARHHLGPRSANSTVITIPATQDPLTYPR